MWYVAAGSVFVYEVGDADVMDDLRAIVRPQPTDAPEATAALFASGEILHDGTVIVPGAYYANSDD